MELLGPRARLPYATPELPGIGGRLRASPADFVVEELALYAPSGAGEHVYLTLTREGQTTRAVQEALARLFGLRPHDVGLAGLKDKHARTTQTFSLHLVRGQPEEVAARVRGELGLEVTTALRHANKLRRGHLLGNRFRILVREVGPDALERARAVGAALTQRGLPNLFGPQRFGERGDNAERARELFLRPRRGWLADLLLSAWQSWLFHAWLVERARTLGLDQAHEGDRRDRHTQEITGPLFGAEMRWAEGLPGELERAVLAASEVDQAALERAGLPGTRRVARIHAEELTLEACAEGLVLGFRLPRGSYATTLLREFQKVETAAPAEDELTASEE